MEIEAIFSFANQYPSCAIDDIPGEIAAQIDHVYEYANTIKRRGLVGLRFSYGNLANRMISQRYADSADWKHELAAISDYSTVLELFSQQCEDICPSALEVVL